MENAKKFVEALRADAKLAEKLNEANKAYEGKELSEQERRDAIERDLLPIIKAAGYDVTIAELEAFGQQAKPATGELSDDELEAVAGGMCFCTFGGVGGGKTQEKDNYYCGCQGYGQGGDGKDEHWQCVCVGVGVGDDYGW